MAGFLYMPDLTSVKTSYSITGALTYTIVVRCGNDQQSQALSAFRFTKELLLQGHQVIRVFFYQQAVCLASEFKVMPQDETNLTLLWQQLSIDHDIELGVCITAALQAGVVDQQEANRYELRGNNLASGFTLVGLGQLAAASIECDRLVSFGG